MGAAEPQLSELLLSTGRSIIAEAAPNDPIWGIGLALKDTRAKDPKHWCGRNVLGHALMRARAHLRGDPTETLTFGANETVPDLEKEVLEANQNSTLPVQKMNEDEKKQTSPDNFKPRRWGKKDAAVAELPSNVTLADASSYPDVNSAMAEPGHSVCYAVLDFEATCDDGRQLLPQEIIEFPIVLVHGRTGKVLTEFRTYVRPVHHPRLT